MASILPNLQRGLMRSFYATAALFFTLLTACATAPAVRPEPENLYWPSLPDTPRIKYVRSIYSEDDLGRPYSLREILFGKTYIDTLSRPYSVFAQGDRLYITDIVAMQAAVYDFKEKAIVRSGRETTIRVPSATVADSEGTFYVADASKSRIIVYDAQGQNKGFFPLADAKPVALAINQSLGRIYVIDRTSHKVIVLDRSGEVLFQFGSRGSEQGMFNMPLGIATDRSGKVYVLDSGNFRVQIFDADGKFIHAFGEPGDRPGFFSNPKGIAVDSEEHIYVTDAGFSNFQVFDQKGNILLFVGRLGSAPGELYLPAGIAIDEHDRIYIADQLNGRVAVFQYLKSK